jgi:amino acid transporter
MSFYSVRGKHFDIVVSQANGISGWAGSNSVVFGEYILNAAQVEVTRWNQRGVGLACITSAFLIHGFALKWGVRLQNFLGVIKLLILLIIIFAGFVSTSDSKPMA